MSKILLKHIYIERQVSKVTQSTGRQIRCIYVRWLVIDTTVHSRRKQKVMGYRIHLLYYQNNNMIPNVLA